MIRNATAEDVPIIWQMIYELAVFEKLDHQVTGSVELLQQNLAKGACWAMVSEVEGEIVGYALGFHTFSTFKARPGTWLEDLFVRPEHRGKGYGKELLKHVRQYALDRGDGRVEWCVLDWNVNAIQVYEKFGATILPDWRVCRIDLDELK